MTKGWSWNSNPGVPRSRITQQCNTILKYKGRGLALPRDFNASLRFSRNSTATFSWQMRPSFSPKRQQQKLTWHDPPLARKYTCLVQGWAPIQAGANLSFYSRQKKRHQPLSSGKSCEISAWELLAGTLPACRESWCLKIATSSERGQDEKALSLPFTWSHLRPHNTGRWALFSHFTDVNN